MQRCRRLSVVLSGMGVAGTAGLTLSALPPAMAAADVTCSGIKTTPAGIPPASPFCGNALAGQTFEIDLTSQITSNPGDFSTGNIYSLQIANLFSGTQPTVNLSNLQLLVSGSTNSGSVSDSPVAIWASTENGTPSDPAFLGPQASQGVVSDSYVPTNLSGAFSAYKTLAISLKPVGSPGTFLGEAGLIDTSPVQLSAIGVTSLTGLKITGTFSGFTGPGALAAGIGIFSNPYASGNQPFVIYGNALTYGKVPGPLPLLGAGAAFGWSRRLRRRVRTAKGMASLCS